MTDDELPTPLPNFDGDTYDPEFDYDRLGRQMRAVAALMLDSQWRTLAEIAAMTGDPEASISARLRDLRKNKFGGHTVDRRPRGDRLHGLYEYRLTRHAPAPVMREPVRDTGQPAPELELTLFGPVTAAANSRFAR